MAVQFEPSGSPPSAPQRTHWYAYESVAPAQVPTLADQHPPDVSVPLIDGSVGLRGGPVVVDCCTVSVGFGVAVAEPFAFDAVTWTRSRCPMSLARRACSWPSSPRDRRAVRAVGRPPSAPQRTHWYA